MNDLPDKDAVIIGSAEAARGFYQEQHRTAPGLPRGFAAGSHQGCWRRYYAACQIGDMKDASVLDVGCGYGELVPFVVGAGIKRYLGVDVVEEYIKVASERWSNVGDRVEVQFNCVTGRMDPVIPVADWVVMLGTAGYGTVEYVLSLLDTGFRAAYKGLVFSVCNEFIETSELLKAVRKLTPKFRLLTDVWGPDQVLYLYKDNGC